ncbi:MAG: ribonuclease R [Bacteroidota bacterium]|nr:ribonuclease R [Bacteroidota bacterium]
MNIRTAILDLLERSGCAFTTKELARALHMPKQGDPYQCLKSVLRALQQEGLVERCDGRKWRAATEEKFVEGILRVGTGGRVYVHPLDAPDSPIAVPRARSFEAREGDRVRLRILRRRGREEAEIAAFLPETPRTAVGTVQLARGQAFVVPDGRQQQLDIRLPRSRLGGALDGDKVVVRLGEPSADGVTPAEVLELLGKAGDLHVEMRAIARKYGLTASFPPEVEREAAEAPATIPPEEYERRLDLRDDVCFTIDPEDAKDFDDAVSIGRDVEGNYRIGVHIADVSFYVPAGGAVDREARRRGTSVYLVGGVFPMLPERLSNDLCCLHEGEDRLAYSVLLTVTPRGAVRDYAFRKSVIRSRKRFTYDEVERIIEQERGAFASEIAEMHAIASVLTRKRFREGSIDFSVPETGFVLDENGRPLEIYVKPRLRSMRLIEEFMLLANRTVAGAVRAMGERGAELPFLYRVHDLPDPEKVRELVDFIRHCGIDVRLDPASSKSFQRMIESIAGREDEAVIQDVTIRAMAKAVYSEKNIGHFGLGFSMYTHFTSPIRRYPDLVVHRLLYDYQRGVRRPRGGAAAIADIARLSSERERLAVEAERESVRLMQAEYLRSRVGEVYDGVVSGVTSYGIYVELVPVPAEGLVHIRTMGDDYRYDAVKKELVGRFSRRRYRLGDTVRVQVVRADVAERRIDFLLVE